MTGVDPPTSISETSYNNFEQSVEVLWSSGYSLISIDFRVLSKKKRVNVHSIFTTFSLSRGVTSVITRFFFLERVSLQTVNLKVRGSNPCHKISVLCQYANLYLSLHPGEVKGCLVGLFLEIHFVLITAAGARAIEASVIISKALWKGRL